MTISVRDVVSVLIPPLRQFWYCLANSQLGSEADNSSLLVFRARREAEFCPGFWLRGLVPFSWTFGKLAVENPIVPIVIKWGIFNQIPVDVSGLIVGTDSSGGAHSADPRLRRMGWGIAVLSPQTSEVLGGMHGNLPEGPQTIPRGELYAFLQLALHSLGEAPVVIDSQYVVGGVHKGPGEQHPRNQDLWELLWDTLAERDGGLGVTKVKSHPTASQAKGFPTLHLLANQAADQEAAKGAALAGLPTRTIQEFEQLDRFAWLVQSRLVCITMHILENHSEKHKPRRIPKKRAREPSFEEHREAMGSTQHVLREYPKFVKCTKCYRSGPKSQAHHWLRLPCNRHLPFGLHPSHTRFFGVHRGLPLCFRCGAFAKTRLVNLKKQCPDRPTESGKCVLKRISKNKLPYGLKAWPDDEGR